MPFTVLLLAACGGSSSSGNARSPASPPPPPPPPPANNAPEITGAPADSVLQGASYSFTPTASDPDGDTLTFSISGQPSWASFDPATGTLSGIPGSGDVGIVPAVTITVSDGEASDSLAAFTITVVGVAIDSATLSWTAPVSDADGSPLVDLAGYVIRWGSESGVYTDSTEIDNPGITRYVLSDLDSGTYYFVVAALDTSGNESAYSNEFSAEIP